MIDLSLKKGWPNCHPAKGQRKPEFHVFFPKVLCSKAFKLKLDISNRYQIFKKLENTFHLINRSLLLILNSPDLIEKDFSEYTSKLHS